MSRDMRECPNCGQAGAPECRTACMAERARMIDSGVGDVLYAIDNPDDPIIDTVPYLRRLRRYAAEIAAFLAPSTGPGGGAEGGGR